MKVLFVCLGNMVRSQMAEAFYNALTKSRDAQSAGTAATGWDSASRRAITVMNERGISLDGHYSKQVTAEMVDDVDKVVLFTVDDVPPFVVDSNKVEHWDIEDLGFGLEDSVSQDRTVRDAIFKKIDKLVETTI